MCRISLDEPRWPSHNNNVMVWKGRGGCEVDRIDWQDPPTLLIKGSW